MTAPGPTTSARAEAHVALDVLSTNRAYSDDEKPWYVTIVATTSGMCPLRPPMNIH